MSLIAERACCTYAWRMGHACVYYQALSLDRGVPAGGDISVDVWGHLPRPGSVIGTGTSRIRGPRRHICFHLRPVFFFAAWLSWSSRRIGGPTCDPHAQQESQGKCNHVAHCPTSQRTSTGQGIQKEAGLAPEESGCVFCTHHPDRPVEPAPSLSYLLPAGLPELTSRLAGDARRGRGRRKPVFRSNQKLNLHFNWKKKWTGVTLPR